MKRAAELARAAQAALKAQEDPSGHDAVEIPHLLVNSISLRGHANTEALTAPRLDLQHGSADLVASGAAPALTVTNDQGPALALRGSAFMGSFEYRFPERPRSMCRGQEHLLENTVLAVKHVEVQGERVILHLALSPCPFQHHGGRALSCMEENNEHA